MGLRSSVSQARKRNAIEDAVKEKSNTYLERFDKHSFVLGEACVDYTQYEAVITRLVHMIEKGLSYIDYRAGFGSKNIETILGLMGQYKEEGYDTGAFFYQTAISTLNAYVEKNKEYGLEDNKLKERIDAMGGTSNNDGGVISFDPLSTKEVQELGYEQFVLNRHSMRHFSDASLDVSDIEKAISLAQHTPSACNRQGWRCLVVSDKNIIAEVLKNQNGNEGFGQEFDKLIVVTADLRCFNRDRELFQAYIDGGMYAQSVLNALHYEHIASVPLSASLRKEQEENVRGILKLNDAEVLIIFIGVGNYPDVCQTARSERRPVKDITII